MAAEIQYRAATTGSNLYAVLRDNIGGIWSPAASAFVRQVNADWAGYALFLAESPPGGYLYLGDMPAAPSGRYVAGVLARLGDVPALSDTWLGSQEIRWNGLAVPAPAGIVPTITDLADFKAYGRIDTSDGDATLSLLLAGTEQDVFDRIGATYTAQMLPYDLKAAIFASALGKSETREAQNVVQLFANKVVEAIIDKYRFGHSFQP